MKLKKLEKHSNSEIVFGIDNNKYILWNVKDFLFRWVISIHVTCEENISQPDH